MDLEIVDITFRTSHPLMQKPPGKLCHSEGPFLQPPHWNGALNCNHPVSFSKGEQIRVDVRVKNNSRIYTRDLVVEGLGTKQGWKFSTKFILGSLPGTIVTATLTCDTKLPRRITRISEKIEWFAKEGFGGKRVSLGVTGPHEVFVTWDRPIDKSSRGLSNVVTYNRLLALTSRNVAGELTDLNSIATAIHKHCNSQFSGTLANLSDKDWQLLHNNGTHIWGLNDFPPNSAPGMCGEVSHLMEFMYRQLGIHATRKHVHATDDRSVLLSEKNTSYYNDGKYVAPKKRLRSHNHTDRSGVKHGDEELWMNFGGSKDSYNLQGGEGCCEVTASKRLYAGMLGVFGERINGRNAVHDLMLKLEKQYSWHFLTWAYQGSKPCKAGPFPKVPN